MEPKKKPKKRNLVKKGVIELSMILLTFSSLYVVINTSLEKSVNINNLMNPSNVLKFDEVKGIYEPSSIKFTTRVFTESETTYIKETIENANNMSLLNASLADFIIRNNLDIQLNQQKEGIMLTFNHSLLFDSGEHTLKKSAKDILLKITDFLNEVENDIQVEGHSDDKLFADGSNSNWSLSTERANSVIQILLDGGVSPKRLSSVGFADTKPLITNDTEENRQKNRRVVIFIKQN